MHFFNGPIGKNSLRSLVDAPTIAKQNVGYLSGDSTLLIFTSFCFNIARLSILIPTFVGAFI